MSHARPGQCPVVQFVRRSAELDVLKDWTPARIAEHVRAAAGVPDLEVEILALMPVTLAGEAVADAW